MKNITKIIALFCIFNYSNNVFAQEKADDYNRSFKLAVGVIGGVPLNDPYSFNMGGDVRLQYNISESYSLCLTAGYNNLSIKDDDLFVKNDDLNFAYVPIKVGYKTFLFQNEFYVMGEIGGAFSTTRTYHYNSMIFSPSLGYASKYVDISLGYQFLKDFPMVKDNAMDHGLAQLMLRFAYAFDL